jgi:hypothetical protein
MYVNFVDVFRTFGDGMLVENRCPQLYGQTLFNIKSAGKTATEKIQFAQNIKVYYFCAVKIV